jgi:hypothetical protein
MQGSQKWLIHHIADVQQSNNKLRKRFTKGAFSINIALLITESINEAKDNHETLILITLDVEKAFDVVDHIHLYWKIYHQDITGSPWLLIQELYREGKYTIRISLKQPGY